MNKTSRRADFEAEEAVTDTPQCPECGHLITVRLHPPNAGYPILGPNETCPMCGTPKPFAFAEEMKSWRAPTPSNNRPLETTPGSPMADLEFMNEVLADEDPAPHKKPTIISRIRSWFS